MDDIAPAVFVADLFVRKSHRRQGIGEAFMSEVRGLAQDLGATKVFWTAWKKNKGAIAFYEKLGAVPFDDEILMVWVASGEAMNSAPPGDQTL